MTGFQLTRLFRLYFGVAVGLLSVFSLAAADNDSTECIAGKNLLADTDFASLEAGSTMSLWSARQHARDGSFTAIAKDNVLSIEKVGKEPWFVLTQRLRKGDFAGKTLRYSAMLKLDISVPEPTHGFNYEAGLYLEAKNRNRRRVFRTSAEHEPNFGKSDWMEISVEAALPEDVKSLEVGFVHKGGGVLQVRRPSLRVLEAGSCTP